MELIQLKYSGHIFKTFRNVFPTNTDIKPKPSVWHDLDLWGLTSVILSLTRHSQHQVRLHPDSFTPGLRPNPLLR